MHSSGGYDGCYYYITRTVTMHSSGGYDGCYYYIIRTIPMHCSGGYDGYGDHDESTRAPHVLGEELLHLDIPESLPEDAVHLARQSLVRLLQQAQLHLVQNKKKKENFIHQTFCNIWNKLSNIFSVEKI